MPKFPGFSGLRQYSRELQRDLRELERWMRDIDARVAAKTEGESINYYQTLVTSNNAGEIPIYRASSAPSVATGKVAIWVLAGAAGVGDSWFMHQKQADDTWGWTYMGTAS